jgi:hypothetical protein
MIRRCTLFFFALLLLFGAARGQDSSAGHIITCFHDDREFDAYVAPPPAFTEPGAELLADFEITYVDVPAGAQQAIDYAAEIWASQLASEVPIRVEVSWDSLGGTALAAAGPTTLFRGFAGAIDPFAWYPVALAEAFTGEELNDTLQPDIVVTVNREVPWYFGLDGDPSRTEFDLVSVMLHELGHGLGFLSSARVDEEGEEGILGFDEIPLIFDFFLRDEMDRFLLEEVFFPNPSDTLLEAFTSDELRFASAAAAAFNGGQDPSLFAPRNFDEGSSISHLDEFAFPSGDLNALMSPRIARAEAIHDPGPVTIAIMEEMGWNAQRTSLRPAVVSRPLRVFPNPVRSRLSVTLPDELAQEPAQLALFDLSGRRLWRRVREGGGQGTIVEVDLSSLAAGAYLLMLSGGGRFYRARVVKQ